MIEYHACHGFVRAAVGLVLRLRIHRLRAFGLRKIGCVVKV
jgi:hypothetical protein